MPCLAVRGEVVQLVIGGRVVSCACVVVATSSGMMLTLERFELQLECNVSQCSETLADGTRSMSETIPRWGRPPNRTHRQVDQL